MDFEKWLNSGKGVAVISTLTGLLCNIFVKVPIAREYERGKYHCTIDLLFDFFGLVSFANKNKIVSSHTTDSKPVKQEVNGTVIPPPLVFPAIAIKLFFVVQKPEYLPAPTRTFLQT
jgi:hypothetical protein